MSFLTASGQQGKYTTWLSTIFIAALVLLWCLAKAGTADYAFPLGLASLATIVAAVLLLNLTIRCPSCGRHPIKGAINKMADRDVRSGIGVVPLLEECPYCGYPHSTAAERTPADGQGKPLPKP
jgi:hypothetical protein